VHPSRFARFGKACRNRIQRRSSNLSRKKFVHDADQATSLRERAGYLSALYYRGTSPLAPLWATQRQRAVFGCRKRSHCGRNLTRGSDSTPKRWRPVWQSRQSPNDASACQTTTALGGSLCESFELECTRFGEVRLSRRRSSAAHSGLRRRLSNPTASTDKSVPARCSAEMLVASEGRFPAAHSNRSTVSAGSYGLKIQRIKVSLARMRLVRDGPGGKVHTTSAPMIGGIGSATR